LFIRTVTDTRGEEDAPIAQWSEIYLLNEGDSDSMAALEHVIQGRDPQVQIHPPGEEEAKKVLENLRHCVRPSAKSDGGIAPGSVVWATYNNRWWPARVLRPSERVALRDLARGSKRIQEVLAGEKANRNALLVHWFDDWDQACDDPSRSCRLIFCSSLSVHCGLSE